MKIKHYFFLILTVFSISLNGAAANQKDEQLKQFHALNLQCKFAYTVYMQNVPRLQAGQISNEAVSMCLDIYNNYVEDITNLAAKSDDEVKKIISASGFVKVQQTPTAQDFLFRKMQLLTRKRAYKGFLKQAVNAKVKESLLVVINDCDNQLLALLQESQKINLKLYLALKREIEAANSK